MPSMLHAQFICIGGLNINNNENDEEKLWVCPSWLKTDCLRQLRYRFDKKMKTADLEFWDSTEHDRTVFLLGNNFLFKDFTVQREKKLEYQFDSFILAHWFDLIITTKDTVWIVEVKPEDQSHYQMQYNIAQLLASSVFENYSYLVFEYRNARFVPKVKPDFSKVLRVVQSKITSSLQDNPTAKPSGACRYCPYADCEFHPQHNEVNSYGKNRSV